MAKAFNPFPREKWQQAGDMLEAIAMLRDMYARCQTCQMDVSDAINQLDFLERFFTNFRREFFDERGNPITERATLAR